MVASGVFSSPLARRLARDAGIDLARVQGSGPHGRIIARDVEAAKSGKGLVAPLRHRSGRSAARRASTADDKIRALFEPGSYEVVPHDNIRKVIARRLLEAKLTIPHFYLTVDCNIDKLLAAREEINAAAPQGQGRQAGLQDLGQRFRHQGARACAPARARCQRDLDRRRACSGTGTPTSGLRCRIPGGLITPVIRKAEQKSLSVISNEMKDFAARARARKLKPEEYQGGSSAVSNLGMYGIKEFYAIINPPHATILAVGAGEERAVVRNGKIEPAHLMTVGARDRSPRRRRRARRRASRRVQGIGRESGDDGGVSDRR